MRHIPSLWFTETFFLIVLDTRYNVQQITLCFFLASGFLVAFLKPAIGFVSDDGGRLSEITEIADIKQYFFSNLLKNADAARVG